MVKKLLVIFLAVIACILPAHANAAGSIPIYQSEERGVERQATVSHGRDYTVEYKNALPLEGYEDSGEELTDGMFAPVIDYNGTDWIGADGWVGYKAEDNTQPYSVTVTLDLGYVAREIGQLFIRTMTERRISGLTPQISVYASVDGMTYFTVGLLEVQNAENKRTEILINKLQLDETFSARYIKVVFEQRGDKVTLTDEICVSAYGSIERISADGGDSEGRTYDFSSGYAVHTGVLEDSAMSVLGASAPTDKDFNEDGTEFLIGEGLGKPVKLINDFMKVSRPYYSHYVNDVRYIVIHNTGANQLWFDAKGMHNYLVTKNDGTSSSWHYTVDDKVIYHGLNDKSVGWHAATNYNFYTIGIEMCVHGAPTGPGGNNDPITKGTEYELWYASKFIPTIENTAVLTAELLVQYGLTPDKVLQHNDVYYFNEKQCPYYLRLNENKKLVREGTGWQYFMALVNTYYDAMTKDGDRMVTKTYSPSETLPEYIYDSDGKVYRVTENPTQAAAFVAGDADFDGVLTENDCLLVKGTVLHEEGSCGYPDYDGDGRVTIGDYLGVKREITE